MVCERCGYQNSIGAKYCSGCGRKLHQEKRNSKNGLWMIGVCLLIAGIGIGTLLPKKNDSGTKNESNHGDSVVSSIFFKAKDEICQVIPMDDGSVAALYTDGTVKVSGNAYLSKEVSDWSKISKLYYCRYSDTCNGPALAGVTGNGTVLITGGVPSDWSNVKELYFPWQGIVAVTNDGNVLAEGSWEDDTFLTELSNVDSLANVGEEWACLKKDGNVEFLDEYGYSDGYGIRWTNVREIRASDHGFYALKKDGTVEGSFAESMRGLDGAVKVVDFEDWLFGISADGRLLTESGGNIYTNIGDMVVDVPGLPYYGEEVDIHQFDQTADVIAFRGLVLLNEDGTATAIGEYPHWNLESWYNIEKVCGTSDVGWENDTLYGVRQDGSVITVTYSWDRDTQTVTDRYRGWKLQDIYPGSYGVVGLSQDGKLVGDGIYENVDFSVF